MNAVRNVSGSLDAYLGPPQKVNGVDVYRMDRFKQEPPPEGFDTDSITWYAKDFGPCTHLSSVQGEKEIFFSSTHMRLTEHIGSVAQPLLKEVEDSAKQFFSGKISADEFARRFTDLADTFVSACQERQYPNALFASLSNEPALLGFYEQSRRLVLQAAVAQNREEGEQFLTGEMNSQRIMLYYNSDYYYMTEDVIGAMDKMLLDYAKENGMDEFEIPDYGAMGWHQYNNFNSAFSGNPNRGWKLEVLHDEYIMDYDMVPPKGFRWFYQSGGDPKADAPIVSYEDEYGIHENDFSKFDPTNFLTATTWVSYQDSSGKTNFFSADFNFAPVGKALYNLSELLTFSGNRNAEAAEVNRFIKNFRVFPQGYCSWTIPPRTNWSARG